MKNVIYIQVRVFSVTLRDERTGEKLVDEIALTKDQLRAAGEIGVDYKELIYRTYNRKGYRVENICQPEKKELCLDITAMAQPEKQEERYGWDG